MNVEDCKTLPSIRHTHGKSAFLVENTGIAVEKCPCCVSPWCGLQFLKIQEGFPRKFLVPKSIGRPRIQMVLYEMYL
tara:strand:+ start:1669 stop:1899 length:231 start_codon:yes stop_codon:yes gene_type:complete